MFYAYAFARLFCRIKLVGSNWFQCRLNGSNMLGILRGKRLVFVGDSLSRNMWESLVCFLRNSVDEKSRVFEASGRSEFRTEGAYSFIFKACCHYPSLIWNL